VVKTEYDEQILRLGEQLNQTYVAYGRAGLERQANQLRQDRNALQAVPAGAGAGAVPQAAIERSVVKASDLYRNDHWDLVDRMRNDKNFDINKLKEDELPAELKALKPEERLNYLNKKAEQRAALQKQIQELNAKRQKKIAEEMAKRVKNDGEKAFDEALKAIIREQAQAKGFRVAQ
jgi:Skp family chaperone for outer membrane proteins